MQVDEGRISVDCKVHLLKVIRSTLLQETDKDLAQNVMPRLEKFAGVTKKQMKDACLLAID